MCGNIYVSCHSTASFRQDKTKYSEIDWFIELANDRIQQKLLSESDLTLADAIKKGKSMEKQHNNEISRMKENYERIKTLIHHAR